MATEMALPNLSLRRTLQPAQRALQIEALLLAVYVDGDQLSYVFDKPLSTGKGAMTGGYYVDLSFVIKTCPLTQVSPTRFEGSGDLSEFATIAWVEDGGSWRTASNGMADRKPVVVSEEP